MNFNITYKTLNSAMNAAKMFELRNLVSLSVLEGSFRTARIAQKELAKAAVQDFDTFKTLPKIEITNVPLKEWLILGFRSLEYKIYRFFTGKTPEEKTLAKACKALQKANH